MNNGIKLPEVPDESEGMLIVKFCSGIHGVCEQLLREYRRQGDEISKMKELIDPSNPAQKGIWEEINTLKDRHNKEDTIKSGGVVSPVFLWTVVSGLLIVLLTIMGLYLVPVAAEISDINTKLFNAEAYHQTNTQKTADNRATLDKLELRIRELEKK
jgi:hypothetical protein